MLERYVIMETIGDFLKKFDCSDLEEKVRYELDGTIDKTLKMDYTADNIRQCVACMDYTTLTALDTEESVTIFVDKLKERLSKTKLSVAAVCVFSNYAGIVRRALSGTEISTAVVSAGFPASQTFLEVKKLECKMAIDAGAQEVDIVIPVGKVLEGDFEAVYQELHSLREVCQGVRLKVILETGELKQTELIFNASLIAMLAGADFIKTSTGKVSVNATPEAVFVMCEAAKQYYAYCGRRVGIKVAGGVSTAVSAIKYRTIVRFVLGEEWINPSLFRIGTSKLMDDAIRSLNALAQ